MLEDSFKNCLFQHQETCKAITEPVILTCTECTFESARQSVLKAHIKHEQNNGQALVFQAGTDENVSLS